MPALLISTHRFPSLALAPSRQLSPSRHGLPGVYVRWADDLPPQKDPPWWGTHPTREGTQSHDLILKLLMQASCETRPREVVIYPHGRPVPTTSAWNTSSYRSSCAFLGSSSKEPARLGHRYIPFSSGARRSRLRISAVSGRVRDQSPAGVRPSNGVQPAS
jgi:hypothetical protein